MSVRSGCDSGRIEEQLDGYRQGNRHQQGADETGAVASHQVGTEPGAQELTGGHDQAIAPEDVTARG